VEEIRSTAVVCLGLLICSLFSGLALARDDPLEVLCLTGFNFLPWTYQELKEEPMIDAIVIPAEQGLGFVTRREYSADEVRKFIRRYFPRSYEELTGKYEFIMLWSAGGHIEFSYFTSTQLGWMKKAVEEGGLGGLHDRGVTSMIVEYAQKWAQSTLSDAFPSDADAVMATVETSANQLKTLGPGEVVFNIDPSLPKVFTPYADFIKGVTVYGGLMIPREGCQTYAWTKTHAVPGFDGYLGPGTYPYVLGWRYGKGYAWSIAEAGFDGIFYKAGVYREGPYVWGHDIFFGMLMYATGRELPEDVVMLHNLRERFGEYVDATAFVYSMLDFVEKFGVNTNPLLVKAAALEGKWKEGRRLYLAQEWEDCRVIMDQLATDVSAFTDEAIRFKDRALLWVYVTEWVVVTGAFLLSGFVLWTLMVSRRFYRKIDQTRLRPPGSETGAELSEHSRKENRNLSWHRTGGCSRLAIH